MNDALGDCEKMERADQIVSGEVRSFLQGNTRDLEEDIVAWTSRYNEEIERLQQEINDMKVSPENRTVTYSNFSDRGRMFRLYSFRSGKNRAAKVGYGKPPGSARRASDIRGRM